MLKYVGLNPRRRKYVRRRIVADCVLFAPDMGRTMGTGCMMNFSRGGMRVITSTLVCRGRPLDIDVDGFRRKKRIPARVANVRSITENTYSCGLKFEGLSAWRRGLVDFRLRRLAKALQA